MPRPDDDGAPSLFDDYLDSALAGEVQDPAEFCAARGLDPEKLGGALEGLYRLLGDASEAPSSEGALLAAEAGVPWERLGDFRLLRELGAGGMGVVYLAEQISLRRLVALKVVRPEWSGSPTAQARFEREALAVARLNHPGIVAVHGSGVDAGVRYLAMELIPGRSLAELYASVREGDANAPTRTELIGWIAQIARALDSTHTEGIVHRDVKPSNVRITPDGRALLLDFGLAKSLDIDQPTLTSSFAGSPSYSAPEQIAGREVDGRSDVYALGATLYEGLTQRAPFAGDSIERVLHRILHEELEPPRRIDASIPRDLEVVVTKALEKDPGLRYASAGAFGDDLEAVLSLRPIRARPPSIAGRASKWMRRNRALSAASAVAVFVLAAATIFFVWRANADRRADQREALRLVAEARLELDTYEQSRAALHKARMRRLDLRESSLRTWLSAEQERELAELEARGRGVRRDRELGVARVLERLAEARRLDPGVAGTGDTWAQFYFQKWWEVRSANPADPQTTELYRRLVGEYDESGEWTARVEAREHLRLVVTPTDAQVFLFRWRDMGEDFSELKQRLVAGPRSLDEKRAIEPNVMALRVVGPAGGLQVGDLVLSVAGAAVAGMEAERVVHAHRDSDPPVEIEALHMGQCIRRELPSGLEVRTTAAPLVLEAAREIGAELRDGLDLAPGRYLALVRASGYEDQRVSFHVDHPEDDHRHGSEMSVSLLPEGSTPRDFAYLPVSATRPGYEPFWILEREVTNEEYASFLGAEGSAAPGHMPRGLAANAPVVGISWDEADAYADWLSRESGVRERGLAYGLPTAIELLLAGFGDDTRYYVWGDSFWPSWCNSRYASKGEARPAPVRSYPIDESVYGVFDLAGNVAEWTADRVEGEEIERRRVFGGSFDEFTPEAFRIGLHRALEPASVAQDVGFRVVLRKIEEQE